jgi:hypothetical protein
VLRLRGRVANPPLRATTTRGQLAPVRLCQYVICEPLHGVSSSQAERIVPVDASCVTGSCRLQTAARVGNRDTFPRSIQDHDGP